MRDVSYLEAAFENLRHHYGLRFKYENFAPGYRSQLTKSALGKLEAALIITRVRPTTGCSRFLFTWPLTSQCCSLMDYRHLLW